MSHADERHEGLAWPGLDPTKLLSTHRAEDRLRFALSVAMAPRWQDSWALSRSRQAMRVLAHRASVVADTLQGSMPPEIERAETAVDDEPEG